MEKQPNKRIIAIDVYRGLVMLLLLPDPHGGFSFYRMHEEFPGSLVWAALCRLFTHAQWSGLSIWDLIMPSFVFLSGVSMPLSVSARLERGDSPKQVLAHLMLRCLVLFLLSVAFFVPPRTWFEELGPLMLLGLALPISDSITKRAKYYGLIGDASIRIVWSSAIFLLVILWFFIHQSDLADYDFSHVFAQLSLATGFAYALVGRRNTTKLLAALAILAGYWLFFALHPLPQMGFDFATVGVKHSDELFAGFFAHWNKNTNAAAWFDVWFLNLLPRNKPFLYNKDGLTTLNFVPMIATMILGIVVGELFNSGRPVEKIRSTLLLIGTFELIVGITAAEWFCPIVKLIWTPSWTIFSAGIATLILGLLYHYCDLRRRRSWTVPLIALGANSILLYTLSFRYRWHLLSLPKKLTGTDLILGPYGPVIESVLFGIIVVLVAMYLYRLRLFVRL